MRPTVIAYLTGLGVALFAASPVVGQQSDIDKLEELVRQVRAEVRALEPRTGENRGEHREGRSEESGKRVRLNETWDATRNGARLILGYHVASRSFQGVVTNTSDQHLSDVRVEVHLSNGVELGPTERADLAPGEKMAVELPADGQTFDWWTTHVEHGAEEAHGPGHEAGRGTGEHDGPRRGDQRPEDPKLRPLYEQLLLLRGEVEKLGERKRSDPPQRRKV